MNEFKLNNPRHLFNSPTKPGFSASGFGRDCNMSFSEFTILEVEFNDSDELTRFAATFEQHCETLDSPALFGRVHYNGNIDFIYKNSFE